VAGAALPGAGLGFYVVEYPGYARARHAASAHTPYASIVEVGARVLPWLLANLLVRDPFDYAVKSPGLRLSVLIVHGTRDEVMHGEAAGGALPEAATRIFEEKRHNDVLEQPAILQEVVRFAQDGTQPARRGWLWL
jgi:hypothetical protein